MADDLGTGAADVHAKTREVLGFWFALTPEQHFAKSERLDGEIKGRFGALHKQVLASEAAGWRDEPGTLLAAIILLDQFSRNIYRGHAAAFAADPLALSLTHEAIDKGWYEGMTPECLQFLYMPLMHAEDAATQALSLEKFASLGEEFGLPFARSHAAVIGRFGRFPSRNASLGRKSTPEELYYLSQPGAGW